MTHNSAIIQLIKNGQFTFYTIAIEKISFFVFFILVARTSSLNEYGNLIAVFIFANILSFFLEFGFGAYLQRESSYQNINNDYSTIIALKIILYIPFQLICLSYFLLNNYSNAELVFLTSSLIYILNFNSTLNGVLFGRNLFREAFYSHAFGRTVFIILTIVSLFIVKNYVLLIILLFLGGVIQLGTIIKYLRNIGIKVTSDDIKISLLKKILIVSLPIGLGTFFAFAYDKIDVLLIQKIINSNAVAIYSAGYSLYKLPIILTPIILVPLFTELSSHLKSKGLIDSSIIKKSVLWLLVYALISIIVLFFFSKILVTIIYGEKFIGSVDVTKLLVFALPGLFLNNLTGVALNSIGKEKYQFFATTLGMVINVTVNIYLIKHIGIYGAVYSTIITETLVFLLQAYFLILFVKKNKTGLI